MVEERTDVGRRLSVSAAGRVSSENGGMSNENIGENPMRRKPKDSQRQVRPRGVSRGLR